MRYKLALIVVTFAFLSGGQTGAKAFSQEISPQTAIVDFQTINASLAFDFEKKQVGGKVIATFNMLEDANEVALDAKNMQIVDNTPLFEISATDTHILFKGRFEAGGTYIAKFDYTATPKQALYFVNNQGSPQIWTQGQGKYTSRWLPSIDDMNDKIEFDLTFKDIDVSSLPIANGYNVGSFTNYKGDFDEFNMNNPISSYLVAMAIGDYSVKEETSSSGTPLEYYYYPQDSLKVESTYRYSKQMFDFLEEEIGVPYPWQVYKQVPVKDFLYAGMENASCTIFSDSFVIDEIGFIDRNYVNVNAHELAHQWFGNLVTETKSEHHWLHEGFATYYALLAEREIFGDDYFYYKLYESAEQLRELSDQGKGQQLVAAGGSSLTYYQKGAWAVHILREIVGEEAFTKAVQSYLTKYAYKNVTTDDFMNEVETFTTVSLEDFKKNWLYQSAFQAGEALESLKKNAFIKKYFALQSLRAKPFNEKVGALRDAIDSGNDYLGQEAVYQLSDEPLSTGVKQLYTAALMSENILIKQAIAQTVTNQDAFGINALQSLISDPSYATREAVLLQLWTGLRQKEEVSAMKTLLGTMDGQFGFSDGNIRTLWLTLSLATPDYKIETASTRYQELIGYTGPKQPFQLRENAFRYLFQIQSFEEKSLRNLLEACVHHTWRFRENARGILKQLLNNEEYTNMVAQLSPTLPEKQKAYLKRLTAD